MRALLSVVILIASLAPGARGAAATCTAEIGPGIPPPATAPAKAPGFHAAWYGQSGYMRLCAGDSATATLAYYNSGSLGWVAGRMGESAYLGTWDTEPGQDRPSILGGDGQLCSPPNGWAHLQPDPVPTAAYVWPRA